MNVLEQVYRSSYWVAREIQGRGETLTSSLLHAIGFVGKETV